MKFTKFPTKILASSCLAAVLMSGCVTMNLETTATMTQSIFLEPVEASKRIVFLNIKNTSGQNINLQPKIAALLQARGYKITDNPKLATYILSTNILFCDKKQENTAASAAALGAGIGTGVGAYNHTAIGAVAVNGLAGAAVGGLIGKLTEDTIYQMQVDINIKERKEGGVIATRSSTQGQASIENQRRSGFMNEFGGPVRGSSAGKMHSNVSNSSEQSYKSNYVEYNTVMFAEAIKMRLKIEEAIPALEEKMANQIAGLF